MHNLRLRRKIPDNHANLAPLLHSQQRPRHLAVISNRANPMFRRSLQNIRTNLQRKIRPRACATSTTHRHTSRSLGSHLPKAPPRHPRHTETSSTTSISPHSLPPPQPSPNLQVSFARMYLPDSQLTASQVLHTFHHDEFYLFLGAAFTTFGLISVAFAFLSRKFDAMLFW